jgi:hypothetical protein
MTALQNVIPQKAVAADCLVKFFNGASFKGEGDVSSIVIPPPANGSIFRTTDK